MAKKTETRPSTATINPFGLRMQPDLRERMEAAAKESGRSLNAEIVARLEQGGGNEEAEQLRSRLQATENLLSATNRMLSLLAYYLARCAERVPRDSEDTKRLMDNIGLMADGLQRGDFAAGIVPLKEIIELGKELGIINPETGKAYPEYIDPQLKQTDRTTRKKR